MPISYHQPLSIIGITAFSLIKKIAPWRKMLPSHIKLTLISEAGEVTLILASTGYHKDKIKAEVDHYIAHLTPLLGDSLYAFKKISIEETVGALLSSQGRTLSIAESCTGGYLSHLITRIPGSSAYYRGGIIAYHNDLKIHALGVSTDLLKKYGAVSEPVVIAMAQRVRIVANTNIGVATSGVAGPSRGTSDCPVGTAWIAYADPHRAYAQVIHSSSDRQGVIQHAAKATLNLIRINLANPS